MGQFSDLRDDADQIRDQSGANLLQGVQQNPDQAAQNLALARRYGLPPAVVEQYKPDYEARAKTEDAVAALSNAPKVRGWIADSQDNAAVAHDDVGVLGSIERFLNDAHVASVKKQQQEGQTYYDRLMAGGARPIVSSGDFSGIVQQVKARNPFMSWDDAHAMAARMVSGFDNSGASAFRPGRNSPADTGSVFSGLAQSVPLSFISAKHSLAQAISDAMGFKSQSDYEGREYEKAQAQIDLSRPDFQSKTAAGLYSGGESLLSNLPALGVGAFAGAPAALGLMGLQAGAPEYGQVRQRGGTPGQAALAAIGTGATEILTEKAPMGYLVENLGRVGAGKFLSEFLGRELPSEQAATFIQDAIDTAIANPDKTWAQFVAERPDAAYQTALATILQSGAMAGAGHIIRHAGLRDSAVEGEANQQAGMVDRLTKLAQASKVAQRDTGTFETLMEHLTQDGPVSDLYIPADALMQSGVAEQVAAVSPAVAEQLPVAAQTGGLIRIPTSEYAARIATQPELSQPLLDHLKTDPTTFSKAEGQEYMQSRSAQELQAMIEHTLRESQGDVPFNQSRDNVKQAVLDNLNAAGRNTPDVNESYAALIAARTSVRAKQFGITPEQMFEKQLLKVRAQGAGGQALNQDEGFNADWARNLHEDRTVPDGWYVHGRANRKDLNTGNVIQMTKDWDVADQYAGKNGSKWLLRPKKDAKVFDMNDPDTMKAVSDAFLEDYREGRLPAAMDEWVRPGDDDERIREIASGAFNPEDIVNSAEAYDSIHAINWLWERFNTDFVHTQNGAVAINPEALDQVAVPDEQGDALHQNASEQRKQIEDQLAVGNRMIAENGGLLAPNGKPSNLNRYQWAQVRTANFKRWFGDWEHDPDNASKVVDALREKGIAIHRYDSKKDGARNKAVAEAGAKHGLLFQKDQARGSFSPSTNTITLLKNADLSTFLHEAGHYFFENDIALAAELLAENNAFGPDTQSAGQQSFLSDMHALFDWLGVQGTIQQQVDAWRGMDFEERRAYHEKIAESFERYLLEGKAPSIELQGVFRQFKSFLLSVYRSLKSFLAGHPDAGHINDEVRAVFDRMLASEDEIRLAEKAHSMIPLFADAMKAGMTPEEFARYQQEGDGATQRAIEELQAKGLQDMKWLNNARSRMLRKLQKQAKAQRAEVRSRVRMEVAQEPIYRALTFLTNKLTDEDKVPDAPKDVRSSGVDPTRDSLFEAIAKLGGINKAEAIREWGIDPADKPQSGIFGKPVWRAKDEGRSIDSLVEALTEEGYLRADENGKGDAADLEDMFREELRGVKQYSNLKRYAEEEQAGAGVDVGGLGAGRFDLDSLKDSSIPDDVIEKLKKLRMTSTRGGIHQDLLADAFGFSSGDELARKLADVLPIAEEIERRTDERMQLLHADLATPEGLERAVDEAIYNDARARFVATEYNALAMQRSERKIMLAAVRELAANLIDRTRVRDLRPGQYKAAEQRAARNAMTSKDTAVQMAEKRNQLFNMEAARATMAAQEEVEKGVRYLRMFDKPAMRKRVTADYADQIDALLERFELRPISLKDIDKRKSLAEWLTSQRDQGMEPDIPENLKNEAFRKSYRDMTVEEFRDLVNSVKQIEHLGRLKNRLLLARDQRNYEAARDAIVASIKQNAGDRQANTRTPTTNLGRAVSGLKRFWASHIKAAAIARVLDGDTAGPVWEHFIRTANARGDYETTRRAEATQALTEILAPVFKQGKMGGSGVFFASIGRSLNREARLAIALNTGNEGNLQRLLDGEGWSYSQILPVLKSLTAADWQAVQAIWDNFESYRPEIAAKERRIYGKEPNWVVPTPMVMETADGQQVSLRGGYYPIKYDPQASQRAEEHDDAETAKRQLQGAYTSATTRRSFTKARAAEVKGRPLLYTLAGLYSGVNEVIHDLAWHEWLIDTNKLLKSTSIDEAIRGHYGPEIKAQLKSWVKDIAEGDRGADNAGEAALSRLRQGVSVAGLGFNAVSAACQVVGITQSIARIGLTATAKGMTRFIANPVRAVREVNDMSDFMANRSRTRFRELNELRNRVQDQTTAKRIIGEGAYFLMMRVQQVVDTMTWLGEYDRAMQEHGNDGKAIALADQAVIDSQGSGMTKDLSAIERGGPALKLFTVFYSFMNTALNLGYMTLMSPQSRARKAVNMLMLYVIPVVLMHALRNAIIPGDSGDDDPEKLRRKLASEQIDQLMGLMVIVREFSEAAKVAAGTEDKGRDYGGPAGVRMIADVGAFAKQAHQGEFDDAFRKASINLLGDLFGLPSAQINRTITGAKALSDGKTENPAAVVFGYQEPH